MCISFFTFFYISEEDQMKSAIRIMFVLVALCSMLYAMDDSGIKITTIDPFKYVAIEMTGNYDQHSAAFSTLTEAITKQSIEVDDMPFGIYWNNPTDTPEEELKWEVGFKVDNDVTAEAPLVVKNWDFSTLATFTYEGVFGGDDYNAAMGTFWNWLGQNGYQPIGPFMEMFITIPEDAGDGMWKGKVEFYLPVQQI